MVTYSSGLNLGTSMILLLGFIYLIMAVIIYYVLRLYSDFHLKMMNQFGTIYENPKIRSFLDKKSSHKSYSLLNTHTQIRNYNRNNNIGKKEIKFNG